MGEMQRKLRGENWDPYDIYKRMLDWRKGFEGRKGQWILPKKKELTKVPCPNSGNGIPIPIPLRKNEFPFFFFSSSFYYFLPPLSFLTFLPFSNGIDSRTKWKASPVSVSHISNGVFFLLFLFFKIPNSTI